MSQQFASQEPRIVHFGMHGRVGALELASSSQSQFVSAEAIRGLFQLFADKISVVVLSACCSKLLAESLVSHVDAAIGMDGEISDAGAEAFSRGFYRGLGVGRCLSEAFDYGINEIQLSYPADKNLPKLFCRVGIDSKKLYLVDRETTI